MKMKRCEECGKISGYSEKHICRGKKGKEGKDGKMSEVNCSCRICKPDERRKKMWRDRAGRKSKEEYFMDFARLAAHRSTCLRKNHGAVLVRDSQVIATGFNGAARGQEHCTDTDICKREGAEPGTAYEKCVAVHAEMNVICQAARHGIYSKGATLYVTGKPCVLCARIIVNVGITAVYYIEDGRYADMSLQIMKDAGIHLHETHGGGHELQNL